MDLSRWLGQADASLTPREVKLEEMLAAAPLRGLDYWDSEGHVPYRDTRPNATERANLSHGIPVKLLKKVFTGSLQRGTKPEQAVAQMIQESTSGKYDDASNPIHVAPWAWKKSAGKPVEFHPEVSAPYKPHDAVDAALNYNWLLQKKRYKTDPVKALQAYQGLGVLTKGVDKWNGPTQNAGKTLPYYHRIKAIEKTFQDNPELMEMFAKLRADYAAQPQGGAERSF